VILRRLILLAIVLAGLAVSAGVVVVGLTYAAYALLEPRLGAAGASAVMVGVVAVILGGAAGALFVLSRPKKVVVAPRPSPVAGIVETLSDVVRERPIVVLLAAVGAGVLAIRNPRYLASALRAFTAPKAIED
jgi:hypothetical protein